MRLTRKTFLGDYALDIFSEEEQEKAKNKAINKLGQLEDIEDEIGISLILRHRIETKVLKNYKSPLFCIGLDNKVHEVSFYKLVPDGIIILDGEHENEKFELFYKDYKKTWALTKEELL